MTFMFVMVLVASMMSSITATPVITRNADNWLEGFVAGEPLTEEELQSDFSSLAREMAGDGFIPWEKQHPELLEGDIMISGSKNAILNQNALWPNKVIPYVIATTFTAEQRNIIAFAMSTYHNKTCIRFVPRTTETNYISIFKSGQGCWSYVGMINNGAQGVSLDDGCVVSWAPGVVMHELMHTAGFWHEHMRPDRDTYVSINLNNVLERYRGNFDKLSTTQVTILGLSYDYGSVMHYPKGAFAIDPSIPVITALIGTPVIGQRAGFSTLDVQKLNKLYNCASSSCGSG
ncbi:hatching enzyme 1.2-like isoform X1 [Daphnia carinata]|uniref:hatching enzyme 1.2-like isoform X1 n=2 Tax=Daphnia carinata TaxID=120202 RepID=UPI002580163F|nr:hatching enzyme 1.2-like isoform X1 [Daphnia carinata]